jgi:small conductance mechanosensitive channel
MIFMNIESITSFIATNGIGLGLKVAAVIAMWIVGRWIIKFVMAHVGSAFQRGGKIDATLARSITSIVSVLLTFGLVLGIFDYVGVQTTSFAALLAGAAFAIGMAWGSLLTKFAAGVLMQILRPFKVGDYVSAGGIQGTVREVGLFGTTFVTSDNLTIAVGNSKIFSSTIKNFSDQPYRRVDAVAKISNGMDPKDAIQRLQAALATIPNVVKTPAPDVEILEFTEDGQKLSVRPYCHTKHYFQVWMDTQKAIARTIGAASGIVPETSVEQRHFAILSA